jgi:hypothetical protein
MSNKKAALERDNNKRPCLTNQNSNKNLHYPTFAHFDNKAGFELLLV